MKRQKIIKRTLLAISKLPVGKANEIADFAEQLLVKYDDYLLVKGIEILASDSKAFEFLHDEEDIYTDKDLKVVYK